MAIYAPAGVSKEIVQKLHMEVVKVLNMPDIRERFRSLRFEPESSTPEELAALTVRDMAAYAKVVKDANIPVE